MASGARGCRVSDVVAGREVQRTEGLGEYRHALRARRTGGSDEAAGKTGYPLTTVSDGTALYLVDEADVIRNVTSVASLIDTTANRTAASTLSITNSLFDANAGTGSDCRLGTSGSGGSITFDFKSGNQATLTGVELLARQDQYYTRAKYTVVQGSNDNANWTTLTTGAAATPEWQTFPVTGGVPYRYIRIWNATGWYGNLNEVCFHGTVHGADTTPPVTSDNAPKVPVNVDTTVSFAATDNGSGTAATYFTVNGGAQQTGNTVLLSKEGSYALSYWSVDKAGNIEQQRGATVIIDKTAPVTMVTSNPAPPANGWYSSDVSLAFAAADANPGAATWFKVDGGAPQNGKPSKAIAHGHRLQAHGARAQRHPLAWRLESSDPLGRPATTFRSPLQRPSRTQPVAARYTPTPSHYGKIHEKTRQKFVIGWLGLRRPVPGYCGACRRCPVRLLCLQRQEPGECPGEADARPVHQSSGVGLRARSQHHAGGGRLLSRYLEFRPFSGPSHLPFARFGDLEPDRQCHRPSEPSRFLGHEGVRWPDGAGHFLS
jgi:hypothetical protein